MSSRLKGRADGILEEEDHVMIDEIKGVMKELTSITEPIGVHLAQARCYAYIYALQNQWEEIGVQLTYCNMGKRRDQTVSGNVKFSGTGTLVFGCGSSI